MSDLRERGEVTSGAPRSHVPVMSDDELALAECRNHPGVTFFPEAPRGAGTVALQQYRTDVARAKAVCAVCPVKASCLDTALAMRGHDNAGILGGTTARERRRLRKERR